MSGMVRSARFHRLRRGRACLRMGFQASQDGLLCFFPDPESGRPWSPRAWLWNLATNKKWE